MTDSSDPTGRAGTPPTTPSKGLSADEPPPAGAEPTLAAQAAPTATAAPSGKPKRTSIASPVIDIARTLVLPALAIFTALVIGALIIVLSDPDIVGLIQQDPVAGLRAALDSVSRAYGALFTGSIGDPGRMLAALGTGDIAGFIKAFEPISFTLRAATPLIFTGLSVALGFRAGLFNIGAEGQLYIGGLFATFVAINVTGLPWFVHLPLALLIGFVGGALWGFIPGYLKARTGAHEVIVTIMLNYISYQVIGFFLKTPIFQRPGRADPISRQIPDSASLPQLIPGLDGVHYGFLLAIVGAVLVSWLLFRSTKGFEFRAVGLNPTAAHYAGMKTTRTLVLVMATCGGLAGLAGTSEILGSIHRLSPGFSPGYGFDGIAIALLGRSRPLGVVASAILFGALRAGATPMQAITGIPIDLVVVVQALVIMFIAAPALVRTIYRIRTPAVTGTEVFSKGWGG